MTKAKSTTSPSMLDLLDQLAVARSLAHAIELASGGMLSEEDGGAIEAVCDALLERLDRITALAEQIQGAEPAPTLRTEH